MALLLNKKKRDDFNTLFDIDKYQFISLGYSCFPKLFLKIMKLTKESELFDYNGVDAWGIKELLKDDMPNPLTELSDLIDYDVSFVKKRQLKCKTAITNKKYFIRFTENFPKDTTLESDNFKNNINSVRESYDRKINRMKNYLSNEKPIIFLYYEEANPNRIVPDELKIRYPQNKNVTEYKKERSDDEKNNIKNVLNIIKTKYNKKNISLLYFSENLDSDFTNDKDNKIMYVKVPEKLRNSNNRMVPIIFLKNVIQNLDNIKNSVKYFDN